MRSLNNVMIITRREQGIAAALQEGNRITELHVEQEKAFRVGDIFIGKIQSIVKNINAAFVDFGCGVNGYLALDKQESFFYTRQARRGLPTCGDEILVQIAKEAVKTKLPVLEGHVNLSGRYAVLIMGEKGLAFSRKIHDDLFQKEIRQQLQEKGWLSSEYALLLRTNSHEEERETVFSEIRSLIDRFEKIRKTAPYRTCFSCMERSDHPFLELIRDYPKSNPLEVVTDLSDLYEEIREKLPDIPVHLYTDEKLSLTALYSLNTAFDHALGTRVWLKSGGYLILEPTEALTVIDVNTGKCTDKINKEKHLYRTNMEAAAEIAVQLRLRNYSGIILVDFIDMEKKEDTEALLHFFRQCLSEDRTKTTLVDITKLHLAEVTRKRRYRPLHEAVRELKKEG